MLKLNLIKRNTMKINSRMFVSLKNFTRSKYLIFAIVCMMFLSNAQADVALWTFTGDTTAASYAANTTGSGVASASLTPTVPNNGIALETISPTTDDGNPAPELKIYGGTAMNSSIITLTVTLNGTVNFSMLTFDYNRTAATSANSIDWTYNINNGSSSDLGITTLTGTSENNDTLDLTSIGSVNSGSSINLIGTISGSTSSTSSSVYFDNFDISAVPEPGTWGAVSGASLLGLCGVRVWRQRRQQNAAV
jgi:hypothetical protein